MDTAKVFEKVKTLDDWTVLGGATKDGESSYLENKEVSIDLNSTIPSNIGDFKLRIAKEMSAFANTDSGIIAVGVDSSLKVNNQTANLEDWLDKNIRDMLEPQLSGISLKTCTDSKGKEFILIYVPKGNVIPYRTSSVRSCEKEKKTLREYFQRIGTNSVPIPMPIVRSLYLSNERSIDAKAHVEPIMVHPGDYNEQPYIELGIVVKPDQTRLINEYYLEVNVLLLDEHLKPLRNSPIDMVPFGPNSLNRPIIPPDVKSHTIATFMFQREDDSSSSFSPVIAFDGVEHIPKESFSNIRGFYIETKFACDGLPLKEDRRLLIFDSSVKNTEIKSRAHEMTGWSDECLVVSWYPVTDESNLYYKITSFMRDKGFTTD